MERLLSVALLSALLIACGGDAQNTDDTASPIDTGEQQSGQDDAPVAYGRATIGTVRSAPVTVSQWNGSDWHAVLMTETDEDGYFPLPALSEPQLLHIEITADADATISCVLANGCGLDDGNAEDLNTNGVVDLGEAVPLPDDFSLMAILPVDTETEALSVSPMTHLAASMAMSMPLGLSEQGVEAALNRVASIFVLAEDFYVSPAFVVTDTEFASQNDDDRHHALMSAAFYTADIQQALDLYALIFSQKAGQMRTTGLASMQELTKKASTLAARLSESLPVARDGIPIDLGGDDMDIELSVLLPENMLDIAEGLEDVIGLSTRAPLSAAYNESDLNQALSSLDYLDHYLNLANINADGDFIPTEGHQVEWLLHEDTLGLVVLMVESVVGVIEASVLASNPEITEPVEINSLPAGLTGIYTPPANPFTGQGTLTISGVKEGTGQEIEVTFSVAPLLQGLLLTKELTYSVPTDGTIVNGTQSGYLSGSLNIELNDTDLSILASVLGGGDVSQAEQEQALQDFLASLHVGAYLAGEAGITKLDDPDYGFHGALEGFAEINVPAAGDSVPGNFITLEIISGFLEGPEEDSIFGGEVVPALTIAIDETATLDADFGFHAFNMPEMRVTATGSLGGLGEIVLEGANELGDLPFDGIGPELISDLVMLVTSLDFSVLDLYGTGTLEIPDDGLGWVFELDGNAFTASQPNSDADALTFHITGIGGGYIYANDTLVATVTFDIQGIGATVHLVNGESRGYYLGYLRELLPEFDLSDLALEDLL